jgi:hypothetical protein
MWVFEIIDNVSHAWNPRGDCLRMLRGSLRRDVAGQGHNPVIGLNVNCGNSTSGLASSPTPPCHWSLLAVRHPEPANYNLSLAFSLRLIPLHIYLRTEPMTLR